jgi:hypothetical protein
LAVAGAGGSGFLRRFWQHLVIRANASRSTQLAPSAALRGAPQVKAPAACVAAIVVLQCFDDVGESIWCLSGTVCQTKHGGRLPRQILSPQCTTNIWWLFLIQHSPATACCAKLLHSYFN